MLNSDVVRHLIALGAVVAALVAQAVVTRNVGAHQDRPLNTFGVRLFGSELAAPVSSSQPDPFALPPQAAELTSSAATSMIPRLDPPLQPATKPQRRWLRGDFDELEAMDVRFRWPENRDSVGALVEITENDVLIPVRLAR